LAQILALLSLLKKLMLKELSSSSSVRFNNFLFCMLFIIFARGGGPKIEFWSTFFFQIVLLAPLLVTFSVDTQHRLPPERVATWPLTGKQRLLLSAVSLTLNPLFIVLFFGYLFWMGMAAALFFVSLALIVHTTVYAVSRLPLKLRIHTSLGISSAPINVSGIAQETWRGLQGTLDFWVALLIAVTGTFYRLFGRAPEREAFPILSLFVGIAMSTVAQRMLRLDEGRALLRYRLLPIAGWKLLVTQDVTFLIPLAAMVSLLSLRTGVAFGLVAIAVGRYPSLRQRANQRRWRFVGGDFRFGAAQILLGGLAGIGTARAGLWVLAVAFAVYLASIFWGEMLWKRSPGCLV
jgi:hypothetical protein